MRGVISRRSHQRSKRTMQRSLTCFCTRHISSVPLLLFSSRTHANAVEYFRLRVCSILLPNDVVANRPHLSNRSPPAVKSVPGPDRTNPSLRRAKQCGLRRHVISFEFNRLKPAQLGKKPTPRRSKRRSPQAAARGDVFLSDSNRNTYNAQTTLTDAEVCGIADCTCGGQSDSDVPYCDTTRGNIGAIQRRRMRQFKCLVPRLILCLA
jgi:hypothetical protein